MQLYIIYIHISIYVSRHTHCYRHRACMSIHMYMRTPAHIWPPVCLRMRLARCVQRSPSVHNQYMSTYLPYRSVTSHRMYMYRHRLTPMRSCVYRYGCGSSCTYAHMFKTMLKYINVYTHTYIYIYIRVASLVPRSYTCMPTSFHMHLRTPAIFHSFSIYCYTCMASFTYNHIYICMYMCTRACMFIEVYIYVYTCNCACSYPCVRTHVHWSAEITSPRICTWTRTCAETRVDAYICSFLHPPSLCKRTYIYIYIYINIYMCVHVCVYVLVHTHTTSSLLLHGNCMSRRAPLDITWYVNRNCGRKGA